MPSLVIVRHGQSAWNLENRFTGNVDVELTPVGEQEAKRAGVLLAGYKFDGAYTSVLKRAVHTMDLILKENRNEIPSVVSNAALNERMYGDLQGLDKTQTEQKFGLEQVLIWRRSFSVRPPGGESLKDTYDRVIPYYKKAIEPGLIADKNILVVAHGNSLRALMMMLENISEEAIAAVNLPTGVPRFYRFDAAMKATEINYIS